MKKGPPSWILKYKQKGTAIHKIGNNFYLSQVSHLKKTNVGIMRFYRTLDTTLPLNFHLRHYTWIFLRLIP